VEELIIKKSGIRYHHVHIYRIIRKWGFKQKEVPRKVLHVNTASKEEKHNFKKRLPRYLWISSSYRETGFAVVSLDESFFSFMILSNKTGFWIEENKRPIVRITGSHKYSCIFGAISMKGNQLFRDSMYDLFNGDTHIPQLSKESTCQISKMLFVYG
jgi:hypothetical protein